ncbi:MAG: ABC transporter substrate-binding protein [Propionibacteriaceae bacterium]|jgi:peptide/nickel transport system substrate-binding protein|nr:ABC transporter substrate-binding protein [Propionibacteriaceae bacterium]
MKTSNSAKLAALIAAAALALTACGTPTDTTTPSESPVASDTTSATPTEEPTTGGSYILGTTDTPIGLDPAVSYDMASWNLQYTGFQQLLRFPPNADAPVGDAAESCVMDDPKTVTCILRAGLKFANGHDLTSSDVKYSFERNLLINEPEGASILLASIADDSGGENQKLTEGAIETPDDTTVIFHLNRADTTFIALLSSAATSIVDEESFPADAILDDAGVVAAQGSSGPLVLSSFTKGQQAVFERNPNYTGDRPSVPDQVFVQYFQDPTPMRQALESEQIDIAWRTLSPTDLADLATKDNVVVHNGKGAEYRYWVFNENSGIGKEKAVRQAVANIIDRDSITTNVYNGIKAPAYSQVPDGMPGYKASFADKWGTTPNVDNAKAILEAAGVETPVELTIGYPPEHYGAEAADEAAELSRQLTDTGLFTTELKSSEWTEYQNLYREGAYDLFLLGWYPDILDADNYLSPFLPNGGFMQNGYNNEEANKLIEDELAETDLAKRNEILGQIQDIIAEDVPIIPSWNGQNTAVALPSVNGVLETLDANYIFRLWTVSKS